MEPNTIEEEKSRWTNLSDWYINYAVKTTTVFYHNLIHCLNLSESSKILETGCGPGNGIPLILSAIPQAAELHATDISSVFVEKARSECPSRVNVQEADSQNLPFADNEFDRYIANLSLMLIPNTETALAECYRVLKPGGVAGFSIWGSRENCTFLSLPFQAVAEVGAVHPNPKRSGFHLSDKTRLRDLIKAAGFTSVLVYETGTPIERLTIGSIMELYATYPSLYVYKETGFYDQILSKIQEKVTVALEAGSPLMFTAFIAIAIK